ncbi:MAG: ABC transporter ATP-binding protein [Candidatus Bathyarchaeota archaeon]
MKVIEAVDLVKEYPQGENVLKVLKGLSLEIEEGEFMAIMGPSGSGKSTLLNMLGALDKPTSGKVYIKGTDISTLNDNQLADLRNRELGFVFQFFNLIPRMNALSNVELPMAIAGIPHKERRERAQKLLELVGLGERTDHKPSELSGGEQQRVAIARGLVNDPTVLLCDEVTGNLDSKTGFEVMQLLLSLNKEQGKTFVIITHDPNVAQMAQRLVQLHDGKIIGEKSLW